MPAAICYLTTLFLGTPLLDTIHREVCFERPWLLDLVPKIMFVSELIKACVIGGGADILPR